MILSKSRFMSVRKISELAVTLYQFMNANKVVRCVCLLNFILQLSRYKKSALLNCTTEPPIHNNVSSSTTAPRCPTLHLSTLDNICESANIHSCSRSKRYNARTTQRSTVETGQSTNHHVSSSCLNTEIINSYGNAGVLCS